jgi:hypothetical protein
VRNFRGFPSLKEVECSGASLPAEVTLLTSLTLFRHSNNEVFVYLNSVKQECETFTQYSSCSVGDSDFKKSSVRTLLSELREEETVQIGCNVTALRGRGHAPIFLTWNIHVYRESRKIKFYCVCLMFSFVFTFWDFL